MGSGRRPQPQQLKTKLKAIRERFDWTMDQMAERLKEKGAEQSIHSGYITNYENGKREPSLLVLLAYSRIARVSINDLVDDDACLPTRIVKRAIR